MREDYESLLDTKQADADDLRKRLHALTEETAQRQSALQSRLDELLAVVQSKEAEIENKEAEIKAIHRTATDADLSRHSVIARCEELQQQLTACEAELTDARARLSLQSKQIEAEAHDFSNKVCVCAR
jgi:hypothetical protein